MIFYICYEKFFYSSCNWKLLNRAQKKLTNNKKLEDENSISEEAIKNELNEIYKLLVPKNKYHANLENVEESSQFMKANVHTTIKKEDFAAKAKRFVKKTLSFLDF